MRQSRTKPHTTKKLLLTGLSKQARTQARRLAEAEKLHSGGAELRLRGEHSGARPESRGAKINMRFEGLPLQTGGC